MKPMGERVQYGTAKRTNAEKLDKKATKSGARSRAKVELKFEDWLELEREARCGKDGTDDEDN